MDATNGTNVIGIPLYVIFFLFSDSLYVCLICCRLITLIIIFYSTVFQQNAYNIRVIIKKKRNFLIYVRYTHNVH